MALEGSGWRPEPVGPVEPIASPRPGLGRHVALLVLARAMASPWRRRPRENLPDESPCASRWLS
jgi:hypothetical protein